MKKVVLTAAVLLLAPLPALSQEAQRTEARAPSNDEKGTDRDSNARGEQQGGAAGFDFRSRMADAIETVAGACADDIDDFCGRVTPGAGRLAMCMRAYADQFSRGCQATLERVSSAIERSAQRVTEMCWNEVRSLCGDADGLAQCVAQKKASLSPPSETIVTILGQRVRERVQGLMAQSGDARVQLRRQSPRSGGASRQGTRWQGAVDPGRHRPPARHRLEGGNRYPRQIRATGRDQAALVGCRDTVVAGSEEIVGDCERRRRRIGDG